MDDVVCEICGSGSNGPFIAKCVGCSSYQHRYCMPVVAFSIPPEWLCSECQIKGNGDPRPNQGGQNELQSACGMAKEKISPSTHKRFSTAKVNKVKYISSEEVALLNRDTTPYDRSNSAMRQSQIRSMSPPSLKQYSYMKCTSPTRSDTQTLARNQCTAASQGRKKIVKCSDVDRRKSQVHPASLNLKQPSSMCVSPSRSGTQVRWPLKHSVHASHDKASIVNGSEFATRKSQVPHASPPNARHSISMPITNRCTTEVVVKEKVDTLIKDKTNEKVVNAASCAPESEPQYVQTTDHGFKWSKLRLPSSTNCWTGCFLVVDEVGTRHNLGEFKAYFPSKMLAKVYDIANAMPTTLQLQMLPRMDDWPVTFESSRPTHEDIGLFFSSNKLDWHEKKHPDLLETSCNYVMRAYINDIKLLIYSSEVLAPDSQWVDGKSYLWGVFVRPRGKRSHQHLSSTST